MANVKKARSALVHGTCVAIGANGILIRGRSGVGKSDLALRLIDAGARLVADDQVRLRPSGNAPVATAPRLIRGLIEARGVGIVAVPTRASVRIRLIVDLVGPRAVPRLPEPRRVSIAGADVPIIALAPFEGSAPLKVRLALRFGAGSTRPMRASPRSRRKVLT
ncbi:MAG TPA: HPr kinase/phosphatase C-terminal domain-containing protein [Alphaproteobacteria bacterium]|jgi:serine kinase of HPr protein (carbohydrate metabolism regulator)|nr:HPr kinase/phosphatase C-terminal domain-containing protein [Alphaproteobacteria bacterium]